MHPNAAGHTAIGAAVTSVLQDTRAEGFVIHEGQHVSKTYVVKNSAVRTTVAIHWPGSDVQTTLVSPSGQRYDRDTAPAGHTVGPASEVFTISDPEPGTWTIEMFGADNDPDGEQVTYSTYQEEAPNARPKPRATVVRSGAKVTLDASSSADRDGTIGSYDWYVETSDHDRVLTGRKTVASVPERDPASVTLVVRDDRGLTGFQTINTPGIKWSSAPKSAPSDPVTIALLSSPDLDARALTEVRWGLQQRRLGAADVTRQDANADGRADLVLTGTVAELGLKVGKQIVCAGGVLPDENPFLSCTPVTLAAAPDPTAAATATTEPNPTGGPSDSAGQPTGGPTAQAGTSESPAVRSSLSRSGGPSWLVLGAGALITAVAVGVLIAARKLRAR